MGSSCFPAFLRSHAQVWRKCRLRTQKPSGCPLSSSPQHFLVWLPGYSGTGAPPGGGHGSLQGLASKPFAGPNITRADAPSRSGGGTSPPPNRLDIKNGSILRLTTAPGRYADQLFAGIQNTNNGIKCDSLKQLACVSTDVTFAQEFINRDGHNQLVFIVENGNEHEGSLELPVVSNVDCLHFTCVIANYVNTKAMDASIQQLSLAILESMVLSSSSLFQQVKHEVTLEQLVEHLQVLNQQIQTKAMALLIALLQTASDLEKRNIIHSSGAIGDEMTHYLYVLQSVTLNLLEPKMKTPFDSYNQEQRDILHALRQVAFESDGEANLSNERRRSLCAKEFKKLGFSNNTNPGQDLNRTPPGLLALNTMAYFSSRYPDAYSRGMPVIAKSFLSFQFVLENSSREDKHECPFARSSIQLTQMLCEILRIGEPTSETGQDYYPVFFAQDHLLEELFCICIQLLNKTWKEMRATQEDFDKVVREQITRTLSSKPTSLELFKNKVNALNYSEILKLRQTERLHQEETLAPPVLTAGVDPTAEAQPPLSWNTFQENQQSETTRQVSKVYNQIYKLWYCRLSPNHKVLHYGDVDEETDCHPIETLQEKIPVADIKALLTGKDCPHMKEKSSGKQNKEVLDLAFTIIYDVEDYSLNFIASSRTDFCLWTDGLNVLLGKEMNSECMRSELDILLSMEIKLRLLDLENIPIPDAPPPLPDPPSNYHFCYDFSHSEQ
ncbi:ELMO3 protein, partial [Polypterus senegalus]